MLVLAPLTLIGLSLVALPVLIHLLARRRARWLDFPSLQFLRETPSFKLRPRRVREPLLLTLRATAILLLVLGLARPLLNNQSQTPGTIHFILMDASLSMKTRGRAEAAREQAQAIIKRLGNGERACVVSFSTQAEVLAEASADQRRLLEAIDKYRPEGGAADIEAGFAEISRQLRREPQALTEADIISDFQQAGLDGQPEPVLKNTVSRIVTYPVGTEVERNAYLFDERLSRTERGVELSAAEIVSERDGRRGARHTWTIDAPEGARPGIEWRTDGNGKVTGRLRSLEPDDFDADDERFFAFWPQRDSRLLLIEDGGEASLFLRAALESAREEKIPLDGRPELPDDAASLSRYSLVVVTLHRAPRANQRDALEEYVQSGGVVWMFLARDLDTESLMASAGAAENLLPFKSLARLGGKSQSFGAADTDAPALRTLDEGAIKALRGVRVWEGYALEARAAAETLLRWSDGRPAFVSEQFGAGSILVLGTSPASAASELGASPAFPALVAAIMRASAGADKPISRTVGEPLRLGVRPGAAVKVTNMAGHVTETTARELFTRPLTGVSEPGIYRFEIAGEEDRLIAFNSPVEESERALAAEDILRRRFSVEERDHRVEGNSRREKMESDGALWRYSLAAAFLLMIGELLLAIRLRRVSETVE